MLCLASSNDASQAQLPSRTTALTISAVKIAAKTAAKSSESSESTRAQRRSVSIRSRINDNVLAVPPLATTAAAIPASANSEPTDRSIPPVRMTNVMPMAIKPVMDTCRATCSKLFTLRKFGWIIANTIIKTARNMTGAKRLKRLMKIRSNPTHPFQRCRSFMSGANSFHRRIRTRLTIRGSHSAAILRLPQSPARPGRMGFLDQHD